MGKLTDQIDALETALDDVKKKKAASERAADEAARTAKEYQEVTQKAEGIQTELTGQLSALIPAITGGRGRVRTSP